MLHQSLTDEEANEEVQSLKNRLNVQDVQLATQKTQIMKQSDLLTECQNSLNDALHKLSKETQRNLELEQDLKRRTNEFQGQRVASQNVEMTLEGARNVVKDKEMEMKGLQSSLEAVSRVSEEHRIRAMKLEREKAMLEARVRELGTEMQQKAIPTPVVRGRVFSQPRPSSTSEDRIRMLEKELADARSTLSQMEENMHTVSQKFSQAQSNLVRLENEKVAAGKQMTSRLTELTTTLEDKEEELQLMRSQVGDGSREDELIKRIEEDEAKISTLESMLRESQNIHRLKAQMKDAEAKLVEETKKVVEREERCIDLVREKEEALDDLAIAKAEVQRLVQIVKERDDDPSSEDPRKLQNDCLVDSTIDSWPTTPLSQAGPDEATVSYIERLLSAVDRLRSERDSLRRDVHFLESESRFTIESLEAKLAESTSVTAATHSSGGTKNAEARRLIERSTLIAMANAVAVSHLDFRNMQIQRQLQDNNQVVTRQESRICELENELNESTSRLQEICCQRDDIQSQLAQRELQWEEERQHINKLNQGARSSVDELERQVTDLSRTLENVESERNSLSLQVTNLTSELQSAQQELTEAESRYSSLRFQQLSNMSSNDANRALRDQLKEMEMRVARRTEQIGIHQHDIRRLETNLRLQEERLSEMNAELETLAAQKDAMVEDCADAREARDVALSRVEALEMELESLEVRLDQSDQGLVSFVSVFVQAISKSKQAARRSRDKEANLTQELDAAYALQRTLNTASEQDKRTISTLCQGLDDSGSHVRQMGIAVSVSRIEARNTAHTVQALLAERSQLENQIQELTLHIGQREEHVISTTQELEVSRHEVATNGLLIKELEARISELRLDIEKKAKEYQSVVDELALHKERLRESLGNGEAQVADKNTVEAALAEVGSRHAQELQTLHQQLETTSNALQELRVNVRSMEEDKERMISEFASAQQELEQRMASMSAAMLQGSQTKAELLSLQKEHDEQLSCLRDGLKSSKLDCERAHERIQELELSHQTISEELAGAHVSHREELASMAEEGRATKEKQENDLTLLNCELRKKSQELQKSSEEIDRLSQELQRLTECQAQERQEYDKGIHSVETQRQKVAGALEDLSGRMDSVITELTKSQKELEMARDEKQSLQENMTNLEAEFQRSVSMTRHLESQVKEWEQTIATLTSERGALRAELVRVEKSSKASEVNLSLQSAQHKREMAELQRALDALQSKPDLAAALSELEERNNEMEELLRQKCTEIEENDDRVLEILKENKKLTTKVESLNRKVQNLQAKLSAAKAAAPKVEAASSVPFPSTSAVVRAPTAQLSISTENSIAHSKTAPTSGIFTDRSATNRTGLNASSTPKPKTPERRLAHPTFSKAKSPDKRASTTMPDAEQVIGKKRRAPDDFELGDGLPPQGFTIDSIPDEQNENRTPRVRRILSGGLTGFTPMRRSHTIQPSPKRASMASLKTSLIADVTNSPRVSQGIGKNTKRGWLGKIRGSGPNTTARIVGTRTASERLDDLP